MEKFTYTYKQINTDTFKSSDGFLFSSETEAKKHCDKQNAYHNIMANIVIKNRSNYEAECLFNDIQPLSDHEILNERHNAIENGDFSSKPLKEWLLMDLSAIYLKILKTQKTETKEIQKADFPEGKVLDCGCRIFYKNEFMSTSRGSSCQHCYDRLSV